MIVFVRLSVSLCVFVIIFKIFPFDSDCPKTISAIHKNSWPSESRFINVSYRSIEFTDWAIKRVVVELRSTGVCVPCRPFHLKGLSTNQAKSSSKIKPKWTPNNDAFFVNRTRMLKSCIQNPAQTLQQPIRIIASSIPESQILIFLKRNVSLTSDNAIEKQQLQFNRKHLSENLQNAARALIIETQQFFFCLFAKNQHPKKNELIHICKLRLIAIIILHE